MPAPNPAKQAASARWKEDPDRQKSVRNADRNQSACGSLDAYMGVVRITNKAFVITSG